MVLPEDVQAVLPSVAAHRLRPGLDSPEAAPENPAEYLLRTPLPHP